MDKSNNYQPRWTGRGIGEAGKKLYESKKQIESEEKNGEKSE